MIVEEKKYSRGLRVRDTFSSMFSLVVHITESLVNHLLVLSIVFVFIIHL